MSTHSNHQNRFPCRKRVRDALKILGLTLKEAKYTLLNDHKTRKASPVSSSDDVIELGNETRAWKTVHLYLKSQFYRHRIETHLANYMTGVTSLSQLLHALSDCAIKHDQAPEIYQTLRHIINVMNEQHLLFKEPWESLPESTIKALKRKANLIKNQSDAIWDFEAVLRSLLRRCRLRPPNKIVPVYPYPDYILNEALRDWQFEWGWIAIPATIR